MLLPLVVVVFVVKSSGNCFGSHHMKAEAHPARKSHAIIPFSLVSPWWTLSVSENVSMKAEEFIACNVSVSPSLRTTSADHRTIWEESRINLLLREGIWHQSGGHQVSILTSIWVYAEQ
jgi:hypothetical protein